MGVLKGKNIEYQSALEHTLYRVINFIKGLNTLQHFKKYFES